MSETTEKPPTGEGFTPRGSPDSVPAEPPEPTPAPAEAPQEAPQEPAEPEAPKEIESRFNKRIAHLTARLSGAQRERDEVARRLATLEAQARANLPPQPSIDPQLQAAIDQAAEAKFRQQWMAEKGREFHDAGRDAYPDWQQRMSDLQAMGAVPISTMFLTMPEGHKVAAALRDNPEELERILAVDGEQARAVELGRYAQKVAAQPTRSVSRVPAPPKPVAGRVAPQFVEQQASVEQLLEHYSRQAMQRRRNGG